MKTFWIALSATSLAIGSTAIAASNPCPPHEPGTYPWLTNEVIKGDLWAWVYLKLDKDGHPDTCLMGDNNIHDPDLRFYACRAMRLDWQPAANETVAPGSTIKRFFLMPGPEHEKANHEARKRYFAEHPDERPGCYPEG